MCTSKPRASPLLASQTLPKSGRTPCKTLYDYIQRNQVARPDEDGFFVALETVSGDVPVSNRDGDFSDQAEPWFNQLSRPEPPGKPTQEPTGSNVRRFLSRSNLNFPIEFAAAIRDYINEYIDADPVHHKQAHIAHAAFLDPTHLSHLAIGDKNRRPERDTIILIAVGLVVEPFVAHHIVRVANHLLFLSDYASITRKERQPLDGDPA